MSMFNDRPSSRSDPVVAFVWPLLLLVMSMAFLVWWFWPAGSGLNPHAEVRPVDARAPLAQLEDTNIDIYKRASPTVVHVTNLLQERGLFSGFQEVPRGTGSGFIWDVDGHIVTNHHVVQGADAARVILSDHTSYNAKKIWSYPDKDIAVIWIDAPKSKLRPILIGTSHDLKVGQLAYAIGNPFGLDQTMTNGIVSALGREIQSVTGRSIHGVIQTNAAINPGNSGGPLLDSAGRLIGMNTSIISPSGAFAGIGFAIPVDEINRVVPQLIQSGKIVRPMLGVQLAEDQLAQQLGVDQGALIIHVAANSPAAQAGLKGTRREASGDIQLGDIILAIGDTKITAAKDVSTAIDQHKVGDTVTLTILREGQQRKVTLTLKAMD